MRRAALLLLMAACGVDTQLVPDLCATQTASARTVNADGVLVLYAELWHVDPAPGQPRERAILEVDGVESATLVPGSVSLGVRLLRVRKEDGSLVADYCRVSP